MVDQNLAGDRREIDAVSGTATTGHVWDGIRELNTPLPRWWLWLFYATIIWSVGYWLVYPSWPLVASYTTGMFGWHSREAIDADLAALKAQRGPMVGKLAAASLQEIVADPVLLEFARAQGRPAFAENCAPCHGAGGGGATRLSQSQRRRMDLGRQARRDRTDDPPWHPRRRRRGPTGCRHAGLRP